MYSVAGFIKLAMLPALLAGFIQDQAVLRHDVVVALKLVHVTVVDKKGEPVTDLQPSEFIVYDNKDRRTLTEFERHSLSAKALNQEPLRPVTPSAPPSPPETVQTPNRKLFLFFDLAYNTSKGILASKQAALHLLDRELSATDEVGVLSYSALSGFRMNEFLSTDHARIRQTVAALGLRGIVGRAANVESDYLSADTAPGESGDPNLTADRLEAKSQALIYLKRITELAKALRYLPGCKQIALFSTGIPYSMIQGSMGFGKSVDPGNRVLQDGMKEMLREFAASNTSIYAFNTLGEDIDVFARDAKAFENQSKTASASPQVTDMFRKPSATGESSLREMARASGGQYFGDIYEYGKNLADWNGLTGSYYVLGYAVNEKWDGRYHKIRVEVTRKGCRVSAQAGYYAPKPFGEYSKFEKRLHLVDLALSDRPLLQDPLRFPLQAQGYMAGGLTRLQISAAIPQDVLAQFREGKVEIVSLIFDGQENVVDLQRTEEDFARRQGMSVIYTTGALVSPGVYKSRVVIRDLKTGKSAVATAPAMKIHPPAAGILFNPPLFFAPRESSIFLEGNSAGRAHTAVWRKTYLTDPSRFEPVIGDPRADQRGVFGLITCPLVGADPQLGFRVGLSNEASKGTEIVPLALSRAEPSSDDALYRIEFPLVDMRPGEYRLHVVAFTLGGPNIAAAEFPLRILQGLR